MKSKERKEEKKKKKKKVEKLQNYLHGGSLWNYL